MPTPQLIQLRPLGLNEDALPGANPEFYTVADNMLSQDGYMVRMQHDSTALPGVTGGVINDPLFLLSCAQFPRSTLNNNYILMSGFVGGIGELIAQQGTSNTKAITPGTWTKVNPNETSGGILNGAPFINNGTDAPVTWGYDFTTPTVAASLTTAHGWFGATFSCKALRAFRDFLIALNVTDTTGPTYFPDQIRWSDRAVSSPPGLPTAWTATATNEAGDATVGDSLWMDEIKDGLVLGTGFMIYKGGSTYFLTETGLPEVFTIRKAFSTFGALGLNCIQDIGGFHYVVGENDIVRHDGRRAESIVNRSMRTFFYNDMQTPTRTYTAFNPQNNEFLVCYRSDGAGKSYADMALVYDGSKWGVREIGDPDTHNADGDEGYPHMTAASTFANATQARLIAANPDASTEQARVQNVRLGSTSDAPYTLEVSGIELNPSHRATISRIWPVGRDLVDATITLGTQESPRGTITYGTGASFTAATPGPVTLTATARYHAIKITSSAAQTGTPRYSGFDVEFTPAGRW